MFPLSRLRERVGVRARWVHPPRANSGPSLTRPLGGLSRSRERRKLATSEDDSRVPLVRPVRPGPVDEHHDPVAKTDQKEHMRDEPEPPREESREMNPAKVDDRGHASNRREIAIV